MIVSKEARVITLEDLKLSYFEGDAFFIKKESKIKGMYYGVLRLNKKHFNSVVETVDLTAAAYPIPRNLRERLENNILPRFYELNDIIDSETSLPEEIGIEISKLNRDDILYGLESSSIKKLLQDRGFNHVLLIRSIKSVQFIKDE